MGLKDLNESLRTAAVEMRKLADASLQVADLNNGGGGGGGPDSGAPAPPAGAPAGPINLRFVSNITANPTMSSGGASTANAGLAAEDKFMDFLRTKGIYDIQKANEQTLRALKAEFEFLLRKALQDSGGMGFRKMGV